MLYILKLYKISEMVIGVRGVWDIGVGVGRVRGQGFIWWGTMHTCAVCEKKRKSCVHIYLHVCVCVHIRMHIDK